MNVCVTCRTHECALLPRQAELAAAATTTPDPNDHTLQWATHDEDGDDSLALAKVVGQLAELEGAALVDQATVDVACAVEGMIR